MFFFPVHMHELANWSSFPGKRNFQIKTSCHRSTCKQAQELILGIHLNEGLRAESQGPSKAVWENEVQNNDGTVTLGPQGCGTGAEGGKGGHAPC